MYNSYHYFLNVHDINLVDLGENSIQLILDAIGKSSTDVK